MNISEPPLSATLSDKVHRGLCLTSDIQEHAESFSKWSLQYDQLGGGEFNGSLEYVDLPEGYMVHEIINRSVRQQGQIGRDRIGFAMIFGAGETAICNGQSFGPYDLLVGSGDDLDLCSKKAMQLFALTIDSERAYSNFEVAFGGSIARWQNQQVVISLERAVADQLRANWLHMFSLLRSSGPLNSLDVRVVKRLRDDMLLKLAESVPEDTDVRHLRSIAAKRRVVSKACDMMMAKVDDPPSLLDVCSRVGASSRKLNYCFLETLGVTPARFMRIARLNGVHRQLRQCKDPKLGVQDVAAQWGFRHFGQFSADYKRQFAELPSKTLCSARGRKSSIAAVAH